MRLEGEGGHSIAVPPQRPQAFARGWVPNLGRAVIAAAGELGAVIVPDASASGV
jgi:hypothetical protein